LVLFLAPVLIISAGYSSHLKADVKKIMDQYPANDTAERNALTVEFLKMGPKGISILLNMVAPPGTTDDSQARFAINGLAVYSGQKDREKERKLFAKCLIKAIQSPGDTGIKAFFIRQLQLIGKKESIKPLNRLLSDPVLFEPAAQALVAIGSSEAEKTILKSLRTESGFNRVTLIKALGELRSKRAVKNILKYAVSRDKNVRQAALFALANIGDPAAQAVLSRTDLASSSYERAQAPSLYLLYAKRLAESGHKSQSNRIARDLITYYTIPTEGHIACSALDLLVHNKGDQSLSDLHDAMNSPNDDLRGQALDLASHIPGQKATKAWILKAFLSSPKVRAEIISMLGERKDPFAVDFLTEALRSRDRTVRLAAIPALTLLAGDKALPSLISNLVSDDTDEIAALKTALLMIPGDQVVPAAVKTLNKVPPYSQAALIEIITDKLAVEHKDLVFSFTENEDKDVRSTALTGLISLSGPEDIPRLLQLFRESDQISETTLILDAIAASANRDENIHTRSDTVLSELQISEGKKRADLLKLLPRIGGEKLLQAIRSNLNSEDIKVQTAAVVALSRWPTIDAAGDLLNVSRNFDSRKFVYLAVQGYVRLATGPEIALEDSLNMIKDILVDSMPNEEKTLIIKGLAAVPTKESAELMISYMEDPDLKNEAARSLARITNIRISREEEIPGMESILSLKKALWALDDPGEKERLDRTIKQVLENSGFKPLYNEKDLSGWKGLVDDPPSRAVMAQKELRSAQKEADDLMRSHWEAHDSILVFDGKGHSICTEKDYGDFEMYVDWKIQTEGDSGIYLRGSPQVQIWDPVQWPEGSGGLYNNKKGPSKPRNKADHPVGDWNTFYIKMIGERVTVYLNNVLVVDNVVMENYWERDKPIYPLGQIELQAHSTPLYFRNIHIREILREESFPVPDSNEAEDGFVSLFNGKDLSGWTGDVDGYQAKEGEIVIHPDKGGNLFTEEEFHNFILKFEFKLTPGANNGLGIRSPLEGNPAYDAMELQILDNTAEKYKDLKPYQYHGSIYGVVPAKRGYQRPVGEWNYQEVRAQGNRITIVLNGITIIDADIQKAGGKGTKDGGDHPGLFREKGHIGFLGHGSLVYFRNIRIKKLK